MSLAAPALAQSPRTVCGWGYIKVLGVNAPVTATNGAKTTDNLYMTLDIMRAGAANFGSVDGQLSIIINASSLPVMDNHRRALTTAFLAGAPVRVSVTGADCTVYDNYYNVSMCTASSAPGVCQPQ